MIEGRKKNAIIAAVLSFFLPGLGQVYLGQMWKGLAIFGATIFSVEFIIVPAIIAIVATIDAYMIGNKLRAGYMVDEWEFF